MLFWHATIKLHDVHAEVKSAAPPHKLVKANGSDDSDVNRIALRADPSVKYVFIAPSIRKPLILLHNIKNLGAFEKAGVMFETHSKC